MSPHSPAFADLLQAARRTPPRVALVLGSGMATAARRVRRRHTVPFAEVPGWPAPSVCGHRGCITLGDWAGQRVLVFEGRLHRYEGYPWETVIAPVTLAADLGVRVLVLTNAAGGIQGALHPGRLMLVRDHIEWTRPYCWRQPGPGGLGPARPSPYTPRLLDALTRAACALGEPLSQGVYAALTGPSYETPAEIRALRTWGADAVGMSTAQEVQAGCDLGLECAAVSCITNWAAGLTGESLRHEEVLATAANQAERLGALLEAFLGSGALR